MSDGDVQQPQQPEDEARGRSRTFVAVAVAAVICVIVVILLVPVVATSSTSYCGSCHAMKAAYQSWQRGAHSSVPCSRVPRATGRRGLVQVALQRDAQHLAGLPQHAALQPTARRHRSTQNCIKRHPLKGLMGIPGKIRMPHAKHIDQNNLECVDCHDHTAHAAPGQSSTVSMSPCTMCHQQTKDSSKCDFCHYTPPVSGRSHPTNFLDEHGKLALANVEQDCIRCHHNKAQFCDGCHAEPTPGHYWNWPVRARPGGQEGPRPLSRLSLGEAAVQPVPHRGSPGRLGDLARAGGAQRRAVVPGAPPQADVRRLSRGRRSDRAMRPRAVILVLLGALCVLLAAAGPAAAITFTIPTGKSDRCLACHAKPDLGTVNVNGVEKSLTISKDTWHSSMNARLDCTACHAGFEAREHTAAETQGWYLAGQAHRVQRLPCR